MMMTHVHDELLAKADFFMAVQKVPNMLVAFSSSIKLKKMKTAIRCFKQRGASNPALILAVCLIQPGCRNSKQQARIWRIFCARPSGCMWQFEPNSSPPGYDKPMLPRDTVGGTNPFAGDSGQALI